MTSTLPSRRSILLTAAGATLGCGHRKATGVQGYCFVANRAGRSVAVVDLTLFRLRRQIPLDDAPAAILAHPARQRVLALAPETGTIYEIDTVAHRVTRRVRAGSRAVEMRLAPGGRALWVLYSDPAALVELPLDSLRPRRRVRLSAEPGGFDLSSDDRAAIAIPGDNQIVLAALGAPSGPGATQRIIETGVEPSLVRFRSDARQLLSGSRPARNLSIFDTVGGKTIVRLPLPLEPRNFCFSTDGGQLFISGDGVDAVVVVYPYRTEIAETMLAGRTPDGMAATDALLLVANPQANTVTALSFDNFGKKLVAVVSVGEEPRHIVITPANGAEEQYALVLDQRSGDLAVIRLYSLLSLGGSPRYKPVPVFTLIPVGEQPVSAAVVRFS